MRKTWLSLAALFVLAAAPAFAQRTTATIRGTVLDQTGAVIVDAKVTLTGEETGVTRSTTTNSSGVYSFSEITVGKYRVDVEFPGFKSAAVSGIVLNVADDRAVDVTLETGELLEQVTVESPVVTVQTIGGDVSGLVTGEQVRELPLNGRNFLQLALLMPGVVAADFLNVKDKGLLGGSDLSVSGSDVTANLWTVDGANNNDVGSNRTILVYPSVEAIDEFKILRNDYGAEFGQAAGAHINIVTRGGTNKFHGSGYYFGRNDALNAKNYFLEQAGQDKEKLTMHDYGGTFGGPIIKDKLHFFVSEEWNRERRGTVRTAFVPTQAERSGDFSGPGIEGCSSPTPIDPLTGEPFPGNRIPADRTSPGGLLFMQLYPQPNNTPVGGSCNNWVASVNTPIDWRQDNMRVDYTISNSSRLMVRYTQDAWSNNAPNLQSNLWGDDPFPAVDSNWDQPGRSFVTQLSQNIGNNAVNALSFSYSANRITVTRGGSTPDLNAQINAAIPSLFPDAGREYGADRGHPIFWGAQGYGEALWNEAPFRNSQDLFILKDDYSAVFGRHFFKAGALVSFNKKNEDVGGYGSFENSEFSDSVGLNDTGVTTGNIVADFLLRDMTFDFDENSAQRQVPQRWRDLEFYVSDSWKVGPRLTFDYGVRYSMFYNPYAADDKVMSFDPSRFDPALGDDPCNGLLHPPGTTFCEDAGFVGGAAGPNRSLYEQDTNNFAPRLGVAWDLTGEGKTVVRGGVGEFFLRERLSPGLNLGSNPPFVINIAGTRKLDTNEPPCEDCFSVSSGSPGAGREQRGATPHSWQWNLTFQHEIFRDTTAQVSYVGTKADDLLRTYDANQVRVGDVNGNGIADRVEYARVAEGLGDVRPFPQYGDHRITFWDHSGNSTYHGLQTQLLSRFGQSQFQASYTWSRTIANTPLDNSDGGLSNENSILDLDNQGLDKGLARTHRAHNFNASLVLGLPSLEGKSGLTRGLLGDWEIASIVSASSGPPLTVLTGPIPDLSGGPSGTGFTENQRPNRVPGVACRADGGLPEQILNPNAFTLNGFLLGQPGDSGRGVCEGPGLFQVDLAVYKNIRISEAVKLQIRLEIFNVFNRVNFLSLTGGGYSINTTMSPSAVTFDTGDATTATQIVGSEIPSSFGQATQTRDPRQMQFGFKLMF